MAGQAGTAVVRTACDKDDVKILGFSGGPSRPTFGIAKRNLQHPGGHDRLRFSRSAAFSRRWRCAPDAFVLINGGGSPAELRVRLYGTRARTWNVTRTSDAGEESVHLGIMSSAGEVISYEAPPFSGTTFLGL